MAAELLIGLIIFGGGVLMGLLVGERRGRRHSAGESVPLPSEAPAPNQQPSFGNLFANNPLPMWIYAADTFQILDANNTVVQRYGYSREELLRMNVKDILSPSDVIRLGASDYANLGEKSHVGLWQHRRKDGSVIDVEVNSNILEFQGRPARLAVALDVTEQRRTERALRTSEERFRAIIENATDVITIVDAQRRFLYVSPSTKRVLGYEPAALLGRDSFSLIDPIDIPRMIETVRARPNGSTETIMREIRLLHQDGTWRDVELYNTDLLANAAVQGVIVLARDITARKQAEAALRDSENRLRTLVEHGSDLIVVLNNRYEHTYISPSVERLLGYTPDELLGQTPAPLIHPDDLPDVIRTLAFAEPLTQMETRLRHRDGTWHDFELAIANQLADPAIDGFVLNGRDITERKRAERHLRETNDNLAALIGSAPIAIVALDLDGNVTAWNPGAEHLFGWRESEILGQPNPIIPADDLAEPVTVVIDADSSIAQLQVSRLRRDGSLIDVTLSTAILGDGSGHMRGTIATMVDITALKETQHKLQRQNGYLTALYETMLSLVNRLDVDPLVEAILTRAGSLVNMPDAYIYLLDPSKKKMRVRYGVGLFRAFIGYEVGPGEGLVGKIWQKGETIAVPDYSVWDGRLPEAVFDNMRAMLGAPLKSGGEVIGVLGLARLEEGSQFSEEEIALIGQFVALASVALENARLYSAVQQELTERARVEKQLTEQNAYLTTLHTTALGLVDRFDADDLLETILARAGALLNTPNGFLDLVDPGGETISTRVGVGFYKQPIGLTLRHGEGFTGMVWQIKQSFAIDNYASWEGRLPNPELDVLHAMVGLPLMSGDRVLGVIGLMLLESDRVFSEAEIVSFSRFAALASVVIESNRLFLSAQQDLSERRRVEAQLIRQNEFLMALHETSLALVNRLNVDELLELILLRAGTLVGAEDGFLDLVDPGGGAITQRVGIGAFKDFRGLQAQPNEGFAARVWKMGEPMVVPDYATWAHRRDLPGVDQIHPMMGVPLKLGDQILGVLALASRVREHTFGREEVTSFTRFGELAAIALDNARLFTAAQTELVERAHAEEKLQLLNAELEERVRRRTAELQIQEQQLRAVLGAMGEGLLYSEDFHIVYANQAMADLTGYSIAELIGKPNAIFMSAYATPEDARHYLEDFASPEVIWRGESSWRRKDGTEFAAALTVGSINSPHHIRGAVTIVRDVTAEKELQRQKTEFIANASHELRTPLTNFKTRLFLMRRQPDRIGDHMAVMERVVNRMTDLVEDLLDVSRFERGVIPLNREPCHLQALIRDVVEIQSAEADRRKIRLIASLPDEPIMLVADVGRLMQVFVNLVMNSINYTTEGGAASISAQATDDGTRIDVADTGIGIAPEHIMRIFDPFFRASEGTARGTGLGLSISKEIIELHGGTLTVESALGKGSTFHIWLPRSRSRDHDRG